MRTGRAPAIPPALVVLALLTAGCGAGQLHKYEYEEELYLSLDGSATLYVHSSVAALKALRGLDLDLNPRARLNRDRVREAYASPAARVTRVATSRRHGRLFLHVRMDVDNVSALAESPGLAWSGYRFNRRGDVFVYEQTIGAAANHDVGDVGWNGAELVAFRIHLPSKIPFHNAGAANLRRGNILVWEQPLADRRGGKPMRMEAHMEPQSILYRTLWLFALCFVAVAITFLVIIWLVMRKGRTPVPSAAQG